MIQDERTSISRKEVFINEIIFYTEDDISMFGFIRVGEHFLETEMIISREHLHTLLVVNEEKGVEVMGLIETVFVHPHHVPVTINLVDVFGTTQVFEALEIIMEPTFDFDADESVQGSNLKTLYVEAVIAWPGKKITYY